MKAWVLHGINNLRYETVPDLQPKENQVLIKVKAAGICGSDIPRIYKTGMYSHPLIPGHEFCGIVDKIGENVSEGLLGKRVGVFPLIPCNKCKCCLGKKYEMCLDYNYIGSRTNGAFAEYVVAPADNVIILPDEISYETAAMLEPMAVAIHAIRKSNIKTGDSVAVVGLGTIGMLITTFLNHMGYNDITVIGNKEIQKRTIHKLGLERVKYKSFSNISDLSDCDIVFECVGSNEAINCAINIAAYGGKVVTVGNPKSDVTFDKNVYWKILRRQLTLIGTWNSSFTHEINDDWNYVIGLIGKHKIDISPIVSHRFSMADLDQGLKIMRDKTEEFMKIMIVE